jgi:2-succinyl-6-hydroxy-2,4-cyclohexadiene-1-carboxylate synthase
MRDTPPIVVLVHGFLGSPEDWDPVRRALASRGLPDAVTVDLVACAREPECAAALERAAHLDPAALANADALPDVPVGGREHAEMSQSASHDAAGHVRASDDGLDALAGAIDRAIADVRRDASHAGRDVALCGYSLGGRVCLALAGRALAGRATAGIAAAPAGCVVIGADPGIDEASERSLRAGRDHAHALHLRADPAAFLASWYAQPLFASLRTSRAYDEVVARRRAALEASPGRDAWSLILDACSPGRCAPRWSVAAALGSRLAFVHGALDDKFAAIARRIHAHSPQTPTIPVPGAGHAAHVEQPNACADAIASILAAPARSSP